MLSYIKGIIAMFLAGYRTAASRDAKVLGAASASVLPVGYTGPTIPVFLNSRAIWDYSRTLMDAPNAMISRTTTGIEVVVVNQGFLQLAHPIQDAIIAHEVGHLLNGDMVGVTPAVSKSRARAGKALEKGWVSVPPYLERELAADKYAVKAGMDMVTALKSLLTVYGPTKELTFRINRLEGGVL